ncbi:MAG: LamG domain-containing protein [Fidelibacterota bacterium]|nr:MAG: LamG domain-containing protein [Candidatus Neomarinimicrobiota bacterium]
MRHGREIAGETAVGREAGGDKGIAVKRKSRSFALCCLTIMIAFGTCTTNGPREPTIWTLDNLKRIGDLQPQILGSPEVKETRRGPAIEFNGTSDALILDTYPLAGWSEFTIEIIFRPDTGGLPEQRFMHTQADDDHRVLVETRLVDDHWFLDTYIKSGDSDRTLANRDSLHPLGEWYHAALTYKENVMTHYVNGVKEASRRVTYVPLSGGRISIGCRLNEVYWFKGAIRQVCFSPRALSPSAFVLKNDQAAPGNASDGGKQTSQGMG